MRKARNKAPDLGWPARAVVGGDARCLSIAAASIVAKVTRDRIMRAESEHHPGFDFDSNKGYPCPRHKLALKGYGPTAIHRWATNRREWLDGFLPLPNGIPSRDCIRRLLLALKPEAFQRCFQDWITNAMATDDNNPQRLIAIDGKTCRRSHDHAKNLGALHIVSAWASEEGIALGQVATDAKSNEITAIPELLALLDIKGCLVSIDAMGCQTEIAETILQQGGDYLLAVKGNQPKLFEAVRQALAPLAATKDERFYRLLVLADAFRVGRARERKIASEEIRKWR